MVQRVWGFTKVMAWAERGAEGPKGGRPCVLCFLVLHLASLRCALYSACSSIRVQRICIMRQRSLTLAAWFWLALKPEQPCSAVSCHQPIISNARTKPAAWQWSCCMNLLFPLYVLQLTGDRTHREDRIHKQQSCCHVAWLCSDIG